MRWSSLTLVLLFSLVLLSLYFLLNLNSSIVKVDLLFYEIEIHLGKGLIISFLIGSFTALTSLVGFGTSQAFFTLMSQKYRGRSFILSYVIWLAVQFILTVVVIGILFPREWIEYVWLGEEKNLVLLSFSAVFLQLSGWQTMEYIAESFRRTHASGRIWPKHWRHHGHARHQSPWPVEAEQPGHAGPAHPDHH